MVLRTSLTPLGGGVKNPYKPQTVLVYSGGEHTFATELPKACLRSALSEPELPASAGGSIPTVGDPAAVPALRSNSYFIILANSRWSFMPEEL